MDECPYSRRHVTIGWTLAPMMTKARSGWRPRSWASPIRVAWMLCVPVAAWLMGRDYYPLGGEGDDGGMGTSTESFLGVASVLGLALGVAMFKERRTGSILATVLTAALLATFALLLSEVFNPFVDFVYFAVVFGVPVAFGALLGAMSDSS